MSTVFIEPSKQERESIVIGMGEYAVSDSPMAILACIGLGSCIAFCVYDRVVKVGGMAHVVLPRFEGPKNSNPARYANSAVSHMLGQIVKSGGAKHHLTVKIAGGAQMTLAPGLRDTFKTGERNLAEVKAALERENVHLAAADTGGSAGRTVKMYLDTGRITVKTVGGIEKEL
jgi:chemotaxis protein CheD